MTVYKITGGVPLRGSVILRGAKNAGFKAMIASLLGDSPSTICDLGLITEIEFAKNVITSLGGEVTVAGDPHNLTIDSAKLNSFTIPSEIGQKSRSSTMYVGPLLYRFRKAVVPVPGGDPISKRPIERHIEGLTALRATVNFRNDTYYINAPNGLTGATYRFNKNTHTGTETLLMCAVFASGLTILENAAAEPEVDNLIVFLNSMGARIERTAPRTIKIEGVKNFVGAKHTVMKDRNEAMTFASIALATHGDITVLGADKNVLSAFIDKIYEIGSGFEEKNDGLRFFWQKPLMAAAVTAAPYPAFMTDWQPIWAALMTQATGVSVIHEAVYENRFGYVPDLQKLGAKFEFFNPEVADPENFYNFNLEDDRAGNFHAVKIYGPVDLQGSEIEIHDIRRGATMVLAGLSGHGLTTIIDPFDQIKRGYEDLIGRLVTIGAKIDVA